MLCVIDIYRKYAWVIPLQDKKGIIIINVFQKISDQSKRHVAKSKVRKPIKYGLTKATNFVIAQLNHG